MTDVLVSPDNVPWDLLTGATLEETLYWLLHEMGAKDLVWRKGGKGSGAPDGGRDLEATFHVPGPTGEVDSQRWWVEAKGRSETVEAAAVKEAVHTAAGCGHVDVLVVATNTQFSNPTRDWVSEWQKQRPRPRVALWDQSALDRMLTVHPAVAARLFPRSLTLQGRLKLAEGNFWNKLQLPDSQTLADLWKGRAELEITGMSLLPLVVGERANGRPSAQPWCSRLDQNDLVELVRVAAQNAMYLLKRSSDLGAPFQPVAAGIGYLIEVALVRVEAAVLATEMEASFSHIAEEAKAASVAQAILGPLINAEAGVMFEACARDCSRVCTFADRARTGPNDHWRDILGKCDLAEHEDDRELLLVGYNEPCRVGLSVGQDEACPLYDLKAAEVPLAESLETLQRVIRYRLGALEASKGGPFAEP